MSRVTRILDRTRGTTVCERAVLADRPLARMRGLLGKPKLPVGEGLLLTPAPAIHTAFMRFEIDALFLDRDLRVLRIVERLAPWHTAVARHARCVLELSAGEALRTGVEVNDQLEVVDGEGTSSSELDLPSDVGSMKVMVLSSDRRFREIASLLLARRGCDVTLGKDGRKLAERLEREYTDVVVIDAERSLAAAARIAAAVDALSYPVGIVVVNDQPEADLTKFQTVPKWGSFDRLFSAAVQERNRRRRRLDGTNGYGERL